MNETMWNATSAMAMDSSGMLPLLIILVGTMILIGVLGLALTSLERYKKIWVFLGRLGMSAVYFAYGLCIVVPAVLLYFLIGWLVDISETWNIDPIWIVYIIGGYGVISLIGYVLKKVVDRAKEMHNEMKEVTDEHR